MAWLSAARIGQFCHGSATDGVAFIPAHLASRRTAAAQLLLDGATMTDRRATPEKLWNPSRLTLGVEEEFHLVDLETRRLTPRAQDVLSRLSGEGPASARARVGSSATDAVGAVASSGGYAPELQQSVVETNSAVTTSLDELRHHLGSLRRELSGAAESLGVGVAAAGTMPLGVPLVITESPRFRRMLADYQLLVREQLICGLQIHVGIGSRDTAVQLIDRVSPWLPPLLALSASSPFLHTGEDSGYASLRTLIWSRWPTTGRAGAFSSAAEYDALVQKLVASGVISDAGMLYFDVRPSAHVPTLELRICDSCPSLDTIVLIAGLFRAVVARELSRLSSGESFTPLPPAVERAAMWRAARSGLEGELVDLSVPRSVPAAVLVREVLNELRPELEQHGDWETLGELAEAALASGSSAARQREVLRQRDEITDVVDSIVAETRGDSLPTRAGKNTALLAGYASPGFDEAVLPDGRARAGHARVIETLSALGAAELRERTALLARQQMDAGVVFKSAGQETASAFPIDICPRVLSGEEWSRLEGGAAQRARALDAFLRDIYSDAAIVREGIVPEWLVQHSPGYRSAGTAPAPSMRRAQVCGFDIVRDKDGRWLVLEDNVRVPSGVGYAISTRRLMRQVFPEMLENTSLLDPEQIPSLLRRALLESAPPRASGNEPQIVVLSAGPTDSAYFEHRLLADAMGVPLVEPSSLLVSDGKAWYDNGSQRSRVDVIYLRMDDQLAHRRGANGAIIGPQLVSAVRGQTLTLANALGNGVADDKAIYTYVPKFISYYLGELPLLEQVPTYQCSDPEQKQLVLSRLGELVVKPVDGYGGLGVVVGPRSTEEELTRARALINQQPERWIAQETVMLSTHPTLSGARLRPRHVDLRVFVYYGAQPMVAPAALTRVAPAGSLVVNSSRGGGGKDTWLSL
jgi:glutamate---cysteine ligase / carboxylate-amine ligase